MLTICRFATTCQLKVVVLFSLGAQDPQLAMQLLLEVHGYRAELFAESTKPTYKSHRNTCLRFYAYMGYPQVPVQPDHLLQYAAFLSRSLKATSDRSYRNIIGLLHKEMGPPNPFLNNWPLKSLLTAINRAVLR